TTLEDLRRTLESKGANRKNVLRRQAENLRGINDLGRAIELPPGSPAPNTPRWRDDELDIRNALFTRFLGEATKAAQSHNATSRLAVATLLGAMGDYSAVFLLPQHGVFARQVTPLLTALMKDKDPQVSATAARSLAQINGDPQKAAPAFHEMLKP